jgi:formate hydrogenlyase transcriptional activator
MITIFDESAGTNKDGIEQKLPLRESSRSTGADIYSEVHRHQAGGGSATPMDEVLPQLLNELGTRLPALPGVKAFCLWLFKPERHSIRLYPLMADLPAKLRAEMEFPLDDGIADWVWRHQRSLVIATETEGHFREFARRLHENGVKSFGAVPLLIAGQRIGVVGLAANTERAFQISELQIFQRGSTAAVGATKKTSGLGTPEKSTELSGGNGNNVRYFETGVLPGDSFEGIIGRCAAIREAREAIKVVAPTDSTVLILGETGSGKERFAQAIHNLSSRRERPFIKVNCAAIPAGLIESELFGHERGAFTGAVGRRIGRFEMANGGTLFLDEIGDIPLELQPKLLRVLQEQEFERLGTTQTTRVDVRVVAATSRDLPRMVSNREFRGDLYYRLNVFPLHVPPLRNRLEDIPLLVRHFVDYYAKRMGKQVKDVPHEAMDDLLRYSWPGNVRELQNVIERAVILSPGTVLRPPLEGFKQPVHVDETTQPVARGGVITLRDAAREHIIQALAATNWVLGGPNGAGARLGLARTTLIAKMQRLGITRAQA